MIIGLLECSSRGQVMVGRLLGKVRVAFKEQQQHRCIVVRNNRVTKDLERIIGGSRAGMVVELLIIDSMLV